MRKKQVTWEREGARMTLKGLSPPKLLSPILIRYKITTNKRGGYTCYTLVLGLVRQPEGMGVLQTIVLQVNRVGCAWPSSMEFLADKNSLICF